MPTIAVRRTKMPDMHTVDPSRVDCRHPLIFLDVDGCLTNTEDGSSFLCLDESSYRISEKNLGLLLKLVDETSAKVIISSNWRKFPDDGYWTPYSYHFKNHLPELREALGDAYIGDLPYWHGLSKSRTLMNWANINGIPLLKFNYAIVDDDEDEGYSNFLVLERHFVKCDPQYGLTEERCDEIRRLLQEEPYVDDEDAPDGIHND